MKSGNLNFLEPSGPLQACNGTALPLPYIYVCKQTKKNADSLLNLLYLEDHVTLIYRSVGKCQTTEGYIPDELNNQQPCFRVLQNSQ